MDMGGISGGRHQNIHRNVCHVERTVIHQRNNIKIWLQQNSRADQPCDSCHGYMTPPPPSLISAQPLLARHFARSYLGGSSELMLAAEPERPDRRMKVDYFFLRERRSRHYQRNKSGRAHRGEFTLGENGSALRLQ